MNEPLPYLVEHGVLVWQLALAAFVVVGAFFGRKIPHAWAARDARRWREAQGEAEQIIADGAHTLVGTLALDAEGAPPIPFAPEAALSTLCIDRAGTITERTEQAGVPSLVIGEARIALRGSVSVAVGSIEKRPKRAERSSAIKKALAHHEETAAGAKACLRTLRAGERVIVRGRLRRGAGVGDPYRKSHADWVLEPIESSDSESHAALRIGAASRPDVHDDGPGRSFVGMLLGLVVFMAGSVAAGALLVSSATARSEFGEIATPTDSDNQRLVLAAATPLERRRALSMLGERWHAAGEHDRAASLASFLGGCRDEVVYRAAVRDYVGATQAAEGCVSDPAAQIAAGHMSFLAGRPLVASEAFDSAAADTHGSIRAPFVRGDVFGARAPLDIARAHVLAGRFRSAAATLDRLYVGPAARCAAGAARWVGGESEDLASLGGGATGCDLLRLSLTGQDELVEDVLVRRGHWRETVGSEIGLFYLVRTIKRGDDGFSLIRAHDVFLDLPIVTDPSCPIDPQAAPGVEALAYDHLVQRAPFVYADLEPAYWQVLAQLAARRALLESVAGDHEASDVWLERARGHGLRDEAFAAVQAARTGFAQGRTETGTSTTRPTTRDTFCAAGRSARAAEDLTSVQAFRDRWSNPEVSLIVWTLDRLAVEGQEPDRHPRVMSPAFVPEGQPVAEAPGRTHCTLRRHRGDIVRIP